MQITLPVPIATFSVSTPSKVPAVSTGSKTRKFLTAFLPGEAAFLISMGDNIPFW